MMIVDAHTHAGLNWFEPVEMLIHQMNLNKVEQAVLIQHGQPESGGYDHTYLFECAQRFPGRFAVVVIVDLGGPDPTEVLEAHVENGAVGIRLLPTQRSAGNDSLAIWRKANELGLAVSVMGSAIQVASAPFRDLVSQFSDMPIVLEHLVEGAGRASFPFNAPGPLPPYETFRRAMELADYPNVYIKVPGLGELANRPARLPRKYGYDFFDSIPPLVEIAREAFGARRMMWGSDYPPVSGREGYRNALQGILEHPAFTSADLQWVMGKTALSVFQPSS